MRPQGSVTRAHGGVHAGPVGVVEFQLPGLRSIMRGAAATRGRSFRGRGFRR